jgi:hypothetical protein
VRAACGCGARASGSRGSSRVQEALASWRARSGAGGARVKCSARTAGERRHRERVRLGTGEAGDRRWDAGASRGKQRRRSDTQATQEQEQRATACARVCAGSVGAGVGGVGKCWAAGAEWTHGHEQAMLECDVPSNGTRRMSCGGKLLREMQERDGHIENAAQVFDEMPIRVVLENARVLLLDEASRVQDAVRRILRRCADAVRQGRGDAGPADEEEEEQQHEVVEAETTARI